MVECVIRCSGYPYTARSLIECTAIKFGCVALYLLFTGRSAYPRSKMKKITLTPSRRLAQNGNGHVLIALSPNAPLTARVQAKALEVYGIESIADLKNVAHRGRFAAARQAVAHVLMEVASSDEIANATGLKVYPNFRYTLGKRIQRLAGMARNQLEQVRSVAKGPDQSGDHAPARIPTGGLSLHEIHVYASWLEIEQGFAEGLSMTPGELREFVDRVTAKLHRQGAGAVAALLE